MQNYINPEFLTSTPIKNSDSDHATVNQRELSILNDMSTIEGESFQTHEQLTNSESTIYVVRQGVTVRDLPVSPKLKERVRQRLFNLVNNIDGYTNTELDLLTEEECLRKDKGLLHEADTYNSERISDGRSNNLKMNQGYPTELEMADRRSGKCSEQEIKELRSRVQYLEQILLTTTRKHDYSPKTSTENVPHQVDNFQADLISYNSEEESTAHVKPHSISDSRRKYETQILTLKDDLEELKMENQFLRLKIKDFHDSSYLGGKEDLLVQLIQSEIKKNNETIQKDYDEKMLEEQRVFSAQIQEYKKAVRILKKKHKYLAIAKSERLL